MAVKAGEAYIPVRADMSDFGKQVDQGTKKAGGRINSFAKKAGLALGGAFVASQVKDYFGTAIAGAREAIAIDKQTAAVIKSTGSAAGVTADHIEDLAGRLQKTQTINDEVTQSGANLLLTFTNIRNEVGKGNDVFDQTVELANDMSVALGQDMKSSSIQLGKALNDPIKGLTALGRVGVSFTEQQKEQIKTLVASGDQLGAQKVILAELDRQFGGSAAAQADAGAKMALAWDDLTETVGRMLIPVMDSLLGILQPITAWAAENPKIIKTVAAVIGGALVLAFTAWAISASQAAIATIAATWPIIAIGAAIAALVGGIIWAYQNWDIFRNAVDAVARFLTGTLWPAIQAGARWITETLIPAVGRLVSSMAAIPGRIRNAFSDAFDKAKVIVRVAVRYILDQLDRLLGPLDEIAGTIGGVVGKIGGVVGKIPGFADGVTNFRGGLALVGEQGPELVNLPGGSDVLPAPQTAAMLGKGRPVELHFHQSGHDPGAVVNAFAWAMA